MAKSDAPALRMRVEGGRLVPATPFDQERIDSYHRGTVVMVKLSPPKDRVQIRRWWAILTLVIKQCATPWKTTDEAHEAIKLALGIVNLSKTVGGKFMAYPKSLTDLEDPELDDAVLQMIELLSRMTGVDVATLKKEAANVGEDREEPVAEPAEISHDNATNTDGAVSPSAPNEASDQSPLSASLASTYHEWLLNVSRMMWAATNYEGDVEVLRNQVAATREAYQKPEGMPEIFSAKATSVYGYCKRITEGEIDPEDGLQLVAGVVGVEPNEIRRKG